MPPVTLSDALEAIATAARDASGGASASVVQVPEEGQPFAAATAGEALALDAKERDALNDSVRTVVASNEVVEVPVHDEWRIVLAPLRAHLTMPGVLTVTHSPATRPDEFEERELLSSFADHAALSLDRTQALEDREQMAVISDRDRIARELHDVVIQRLFATGLHMQSIRAAATEPELRERIDQAVKDLDQTIRDIRGTIFELQSRPRSSLRSEIRDTVREMVPKLGFAPSVQTFGPVDNSVEPKIQQQLVAVLREALSNVADHAEAGSVAVELQVTEDRLSLKVSDNGKGMGEGRTENGLRNVRRRAVLLGGSLDLWPNEPSGTVFVWQVPYTADARGE
jgi:signal transduction histidine kinase